MRLAELRVRNYRCLDAFDLRLDPLTAIIGANGTGKSSVIRALEFLFGQAAGTQADVTSGSDDLEFEVVAVLDGLDDDQQLYFAPWTGDDGTISVGRRWTADRDETGTVTGASTSWFASRRAVVAFVPARTAASAGEAKDRYNAARADPRYEDLPPYKNRPGAAQALNDWENAHPEAEREPVEDSTLRFDGSGSPHDLVELLRIADAVDATVDELLATAAALDEQGQAGAEGAGDGRAEPELLALRIEAGADASGAAHALGWVPGFVRELRRLEAGSGGGD